ncbi:MAG: type II secretion system F family protein [Acidobacteriota bacterium]|nr:type II secretion system F family protein [Acidobacteriota bacterium]
MSLFFVFLFLLALVFVVIKTLTRPSPRATCVEQRLGEIRNVVLHVALEVDENVLRQPDVSLRSRCESLLARLAFTAPLALLCVQSGTTLALFDFCALSFFAALLTFFAIAFFTHLYFIALLVAFAAAALPAFVLRLKRIRRVAALEKSLPETIELMARALRAGHSVQQMLEVVALETRDPIRCEFAQVHKQQKLGIHFRDAIQSLADRVPSQDLRFVITAILVQKETGGDLIEILDRTALVIRDRCRVTGEVRTLTAEGRLTGWILSALPVVLLGLIMLVTPSYATILLKDPVGHMLLAGGALMVLVGAYIIRRIVDVEV